LINNKSLLLHLVGLILIYVFFLWYVIHIHSYGLHAGEFFF